MSHHPLSFVPNPPSGPASDPSSPDEEAAAATLAEMLGTAEDTDQ